MSVLFAACGSSEATPTAACERVGTSFCARMYACYSAADIAAYQLPPTQAECVTEENADCADATPEPGYCKGNAQTSTSAASACADDLDAMTCTELMQPDSTSACKTELCAQ